MHNKIIFIIISLIILSGIILFIKYSSRKETIKTETTYSAGNTQQLYKKGKGTVTTKVDTFHNAVNLKPSAEDTTYNFAKEDSAYKLSIKIKPAPGGSLAVEYFLNLTSKEMIRIDTIYQLRIDTLKIKETINEKSALSLYYPLLLGAITTVLIIVLVLQFIP